jgi:sulfide:quinone oxidoreductase
MAQVVVLGAGISGHTAALTLKRKLGKKHNVIVVSPNKNYQWVPSNIWVGIGRMKSKKVIFDLAPIYKKQKIEYHQAKAVELYPEGGANHEKSFLKAEYTGQDKVGQEVEIEYDYLVNATGPRLRFDTTPGLGPDAGLVQSVCTYPHAEEAWENLQKVFEKLKNGEKQTIVIGTGHAKATCQGAAFEYALNIANEINKRKLNKLADIVWLTNEYEVGDFGMGGAYVKRNGYITSTKVFTESILAEYGIRWIKRAGVQKVDEKAVFFETLDGENHELSYDYAMLIPSFSGINLSTFDKNGKDITSKVFAPNGFMKVDADYTPKPYEQWSGDDWPSVYQNPEFKNLYAPGIAFAPPHSISKPMKSKNGTEIFPTPPRTGMPSGVMGKIVAQNIAHRIKKNTDDHKHKASMARMGAACVVSAGYGLRSGMAATMTVFPVVQDFDKYPDWGRDIRYTVGEAGLAGHWVKLVLHYMFIYKAKAKFLWHLIPE